MGFGTLGDAVQRSMHVVYNLNNGQMAIGHTNVNSTTSPNIKFVDAGPNGTSKAVSGVQTAPSPLGSSFSIGRAR
jgi:hypothetical protein